MGSSAGAGSGEFHVYRHLRRKEYARQKFIQEKGHKVIKIILFVWLFIIYIYILFLKYNYLTWIKLYIIKYKNYFY